MEIDADPALLRRHIPVTWAACPELASAASILLSLSFAGCEPAPTATEPRPKAPVATVAPIFEHGEGRGATGCISVTPPVFLSEDEAWQLIDEELAHAKVFVPDRMISVEGTIVPQRMIEHERRGDTWGLKVVEYPETAVPFRADRANIKQKLVVEFVSKERYEEEGGPGSNTTAPTYAFREVAATLARQVARTATEPIRFAVFYDPFSTGMPHGPEIRINLPGFPRATPATGRGDAHEERVARARAESKHLLRLQVQDFIQWLQAQGAI